MGERAFPDGCDLAALLTFIGEQVTWEFVWCEERWYVWATHHGETEAESFKFQGSDDELYYAAERVARQVWDFGPKWIRI